MKRDRSRRYGIVRVFLKLTTHIIRCAPWSFAGAQCGMASYGIILGLTTVITQRFFDAATDYSNGFGQNQVIFLLAVLVVIHIFSQILNGATYVFLEALVQRIDGRLSMEYHEKTGRIAPEKFEGTQMLDFLNKAMQGKSNSIWFVLSIFLVFTYGDGGKKNFKAAQKGISAVFQNYACYQMTLRENISISDTEEGYEDEYLEECCKKAGVERKSEIFPSGYETLLSREFGGVDLSGGQWQRIAIARGFFRKHQLIVLDEPTAAIDPMEESRIYNRFAKMAERKTAIIVTHRLGSVKLADRVFVMKDGRLAEEGTHEELMELNGEYARLYRMQEKWYVTAGNE